MRQWSINLILVISSLLVLALLGEGTVRLLQQQGMLVDYRKPQKKSADRHDQKELREQKEQRDYEPRFIRSANPALHMEFDPADPRVNALGMRGPLPTIAKAPGVFRIAVLGDSVAFGYGMSDAESFPRLLEASLRQQGKKIEVINLAVSGYGLGAYPEVYTSKARRFAPDLVLLSYVLNDPAQASVIDEAIGQQMKEKAQLRRMARRSQLGAYLLDLYQRARNSREATRAFNEGYFQSENRRYIDQQLRLLQAAVAQDGVPLAAFIFPYLHDFKSYPLIEVHGVIRDAFQQASIPAHDLLEDYQGIDALALRLEPGDYTHPNAEGHRMAAQAIEAYLKKEGRLP